MFRKGSLQKRHGKGTKGNHESKHSDRSKLRDRAGLNHDLARVRRWLSLFHAVPPNCQLNVAFTFVPPVQVTVTRNAV